MKAKRVWIVEMDVSNITGHNRFEPTVGVALSREDGRKKLAEWKANNPDTDFRLAHYVPVSWRTVSR